LAISEESNTLSSCATIIMLLLLYSMPTGEELGESVLCDISFILRVFLMSYCTRYVVSSSDRSTLFMYLLTVFTSAILLASLPSFSNWIAWQIVHFLNIRLAPSLSSGLGGGGGTWRYEADNFFFSISFFLICSVFNLWMARGGSETLRLCFPSC
jgi:hypothetical protein